MPTDAPLVVFKLGGSLLDLPGLGARVARVLEQRPRARPLIVVGGGPAADLVRRWDQLHGLGQQCSHSLALSAMTFSTTVARALLPDARLVTDLTEAGFVWRAGHLPVLAVEPFLAKQEATPDELPLHWDVTSDSIAAWVSARSAARELVLLKSVDRPPGGLAAATRSGLIDPFFTTAVARLPRISWVNLRAAEIRLEPWVSTSETD